LACIATILITVVTIVGASLIFIVTTILFCFAIVIIHPFGDSQKSHGLQDEIVIPMPRATRRNADESMMTSNMYHSLINLINQIGCQYDFSPFVSRNVHTRNVRYIILMSIPTLLMLSIIGYMKSS
jgi:magnesium-transporting ATPase (P-type)